MNHAEYRSFSLRSLCALPWLSRAAVFVTLAAAAGGLSACEKKTELQIASVGDTMAFDKTVLETSPGAKVTLTLKNNATSAAMQHNWVLSKPGAENDIAMKGMQAGEPKGYIPDDPNILAHTKLTKPGESDTVNFTAPDQAGDYPFLCTFPGHFALMKGVLKVR